MPVNSFATYPMSWKPTLTAADKPVYQALARQLEEAIHSGRLLPGTKLPPQRELADFLDVNVSTISRAFRLASDKGLLTSITGNGTFVSYDVSVPISVVPTWQTGQIDMSSMVPVLRNSVELDAVMTDLLAEPGRDRYFQYSYGLTPQQVEAEQILLRQLHATWQQSKQLLIASGGQNAITAILLTRCQRGDRIGVDPLVYPGLKQIARLLGIRLIPLSWTQGEMTGEAIAYAVQNHHIKGLYVMPDFQNPTSHTMTLAGRQAVAAASRKYNLWIIEDAIASFLTARPLPPIQSLAPEQTFLVLSLSKTLLPALRLAYVLSPIAYAGAVRETLSTLNVSQSVLLVEMAARLILSGAAAAIAARRRPEIRRRNQCLDKILQGYPLGGSDESLARWLVLPGTLTGIEMEQRAAAQGVAVFGEHRFAVGPAVPWHGIRIAVGAPATVAAVAEGARRLRAVLQP